MRSSLLCALTIAGSAALVGCNQQDVSTTPNPTFDWFEYTGNDEKFNEVEVGKNEYLNPILLGYKPDPTMVRVGDDYYIANSSFAYFPGVPIYHSKDLVNWELIGHALDRPSQLDVPEGMGTSRGIFAPTLRYHEGTFYMITTMVDGGGNFIVTAEDPAGPWSDPIWLPEVGGIDPDIFFDDDGKVYILNNDAPEGEPLYDGHRAIWIRELDLETMKVVGEQKVLVNGGVDISKKPVWIEGPHIIKNKGAYYLINAEGGTSVNHSQVVFKADSPWGPFIPWEGNPILTQRHMDPDRDHPVTSVGHADFVQLPNGNWWSVFLGCRPYEGNHYNTGRETFLLPVDWSGEWPSILEGDEEVPYVHTRPELPEQPKADIPHNGNFTERDEFDGELKSYWVHLRTPDAETTRFEGEQDAVTLLAKNVPLSEKGKASHILRPQQHLTNTVTTRVTYVPETGDKAGLSAFQNNDFWFLLSIAGSEDGPVVQLEKREAGNTEVVAQQPVDAAKLAKGIELKIDADKDVYDFAFSFDGSNWQTIADNLDGKLLSTETAGGFVGAMYGLYAYDSAAAE